MLGIFLDTETNGLNAYKHRVLEIAYKIVNLYSGEEKESFHALVKQDRAVWEQSDQTSLQINGFTWDKAQQGVDENSVGRLILDSLLKNGVKRKQAVFICQNPSFDRIFFSQLVDPDTQERLQLPYHWLDLASMYWSCAMRQAKDKKGPLPWEVGLSKDLIAAHLHIPPEQKPHRAMNGVNHLLLCYETIVGFPNQVKTTLLNG